MMPVGELLLSRLEELRRRVEALENEVNQWIAASSPGLNLDVHNSQLQAINLMVAGLIKKQHRMLDDLEAESDPESFSDQAFQIVQEIIKAQRFWDFFRDKLVLRFNPTFKEPLWVADTVAWSCYNPVIEEAVNQGVLNRLELREPPLTYLAAELSPVTYVRGKHLFFEGRDRLQDMSEGGRIPIPVIELPWDHVGSTWELLSIPHEVGHDLCADLKLEQELSARLKAALEGAGVKAGRLAAWLAWMKEVFADLVALQLAGPAFAEGMVNQLFLPQAEVLAPNLEGPHPAPYVRIMMNTAYIPSLVPGRQELLDHAARIERRWKSLYAAPSDLEDYSNDFQIVFTALMDTPLDALNGKTPRLLIPFSENDDKRIRAACNYLRSGQQAPQKRSLKPHHCMSAARMAVTEEAALLLNASPDLKQARQQMGAKLKQINERTRELVHDNAPPGVRGIGLSAQRKKYLASFAEKL